MLKFSFTNHPNFGRFEFGVNVNTLKHIGIALINKRNILIITTGNASLEQSQGALSKLPFRSSSSWS
jgi:hypothetical protein